ncbi:MULTISPECIES: phage virion morphogenesis protein [Bartonella]|uniref:Phage virion morphogenesis protein n=1 Tax=Bartonella harrusi TaxID=2961895 RepID=A0ABY5EVQ3_9HYPH|nr:MULTISPECIES: phage virion morphogenesis protein [Bartonella]UNE53513.1 phage virion morphogenesis protein [Bartonella machadoae]UNE54175.1 phage virion morphogenesis protein [Bartonella machadoae]UTO29307.1 phage virion morphogenesis protein [Bartonella harrusi]
MSISTPIEIKEMGLEAALSFLQKGADSSMGTLAQGVGRLLQESTRRRIQSEKTSPQGEKWQNNYARTSILYASGALSRSIDMVASPEKVIIGSGLVYARIHQLGGVIRPKNGSTLRFFLNSSKAQRFVCVHQVTMPARPYLGLSERNKVEIVKAAEDWLERTFS